MHPPDLNKDNIGIDEGLSGAYLGLVLGWGCVAGGSMVTTYSGTSMKRQLWGGLMRQGCRQAGQTPDPEQGRGWFWILSGLG